MSLWCEVRSLLQVSIRPCWTILFPTPRRGSWPLLGQDLNVSTLGSIASRIAHLSNSIFLKATELNTSHASVVEG